MKAETVYTYMDSPLGQVLLARNSEGLTHINFQAGIDRVLDVAKFATTGWCRDDGAFEQIVLQLSEYFAGDRQTFTLPLAPAGTPFQQMVWTELQRIPYGSTISYGELAKRIGQPTAARAVGAANGKNPIPVIIPCHRVIGSSGTLTGYAGGIELKAKLLTLEYKDNPDQAPLLQGSLF